MTVQTLLCPFCNGIAFPNPDGDGLVVAWDECDNGHMWMNETRSILRRTEWKMAQRIPVTEAQKREYLKALRTVKQFDRRENHG